jgi:prepilin-type processing-associated H-X9-DG protein
MMPIISTFFGIIVRMYFDDHGPPHIHVEYQGQEAQIAFADGSVVRGQLPKRALALVRQWCLDHRAELEQNWTNAQNLQPLSRIPGADND